eukprot:ANDGO_04902.mRNA.1 alpha/beta hydrolase superfamily protein
MSVATGVSIRDVEIKTTDGLAIVATLFESPTPTSLEPQSGSRVVCTISGATGVRRSYYYKYAEYLASEGFDVVTWDPRGIGDSRSVNKRVRGLMTNASLSNITNWGNLDFGAVLRYISTEWRVGADIVHVGHSVGAHMAAFPEESRLIKRMLNVSAQNAYVRYAPTWKFYLTTLTMWKVLLPIMSLWKGYLAVKQLGLMEDLPKGVAREWAKWCFHPRYMCCDPALEKRIAAFKGEVGSMSFSDDDYASVRQIVSFLSFFRGTKPKMLHLNPKAYGIRKPVGHMNFFREHSRPLWPISAQFLKTGVLPESTAVPSSIPSRL